MLRIRDDSVQRRSAPCPPPKNARFPSAEHAPRLETVHFSGVLNIYQ